MSRINDVAPDFTAETSQDTMHFHEWIGDGWAICFLILSILLRSAPPNSATWLACSRNLPSAIAKSSTSASIFANHSKWAADIEETQGHKVNYPMIGHPQLKVAKLYNMLPAEAGDTCEGRTAADLLPPSPPSLSLAPTRKSSWCSSVP